MPRRPGRVERLAPPTPRPPGRAHLQRRPARFGSVVVRSPAGLPRRCHRPGPWMPPRAGGALPPRRTTPRRCTARHARSAAGGRCRAPPDAGPRARRATAVGPRTLRAGCRAAGRGCRRSSPPHDRSPPHPARGTRERVGSCPDRRRDEPPPGPRRGGGCQPWSRTRRNRRRQRRPPGRRPRCEARTSSPGPAPDAAGLAERSAPAWLPAPQDAPLGRSRRGARSRSARRAHRQPRRRRGAPAPKGRSRRRPWHRPPARLR